MLIKLINPNTTAAMTDRMGEAARGVAAPGTKILLATSVSGAPSIEGHYDEAMSVIGVIDQILADPPADAYAIACFGDPGLLAARELTVSPVIGIAEAAMRAATFVATSFSIVTTLGRTRMIAEQLVRSYGVERYCRGVRATEIPVLELEDPRSSARTVVLAECERALSEDGCEAIVLGCAGMTDLAGYLEGRLQVPVVDGVTAAIKFAEALVGIGLQTSKAGGLAYPLPKTYKGSLASYTPQRRAMTPGNGATGRSGADAERWSGP